MVNEVRMKKGSVAENWKRVPLTQLSMFNSMLFKEFPELDVSSSIGLLLILLSQAYTNPLREDANTLHQIK